MDLVARCGGWCDIIFCLLTVVLEGGLVVSFTVAKEKTNEDQWEKVVKGFLIAFFFLGILGMLLLSFWPYDPTHFSEDEHNENKEKGTDDNNVDFHHRFQLLLLGIFAMGSVMHDLLKIVDIGHCLYKINNDLDLDLKRTSLAYECIKLVFVLGQIYFIVHFWTYRCKSDITRSILGLIFAANLCIWGYILVSKSFHTWNEKSKNTNQNYTNSSNRTCENENTETSEMLELWQPYLYPLTMEFCLMASGFLGSMWGWNLKRKTIVNDDSASPSTSSEGSHSGTESPSEADNTNQARSNASVDTFLVVNGNNNDINHDEIGKSRTCPEVFYMATLLSIILFVFVVANQDGLWEVYCGTYTALHWVLLGCSLLVCLTVKERQPEQCGPNQILLFLSTGALIVLTFLELIPLLVNNSSLVTCEQCLIATDIALLISVCLQTLTLRKRPKKTDSDNRYLKRLFSIIAVLNLYMWFEDSIYWQELDSKLYLKHHKFYTENVWDLCKLLLMPPCIFYRIHVAEMFGERFFKL